MACRFTSPSTNAKIAVVIWPELLASRARPIDHLGSLCRASGKGRNLGRNRGCRMQLPLLQSGEIMHARSYQLQEPHRGARPVDDRMLRNQEAGLPARPKEFWDSMGRQGTDRALTSIRQWPTRPKARPCPTKDVRTLGMAAIGAAIGTWRTGYTEVHTRPSVRHFPGRPRHIRRRSRFSACSRGDRNGYPGGRGDAARSSAELRQD